MIKILCIGKIKEQFIKDGIDEYLKRLQAFDKVEIIEIKEITNKTKDEIIKLESQEIAKCLNPKDYAICLDIDGKMMKSEDLAEFINTTYAYHSSNIAFIIGGSYGLSLDFKKQCSFRLSFSPMTFPHQLMRLILIEQIYRAFTIINHQEYHK